MLARALLLLFLVSCNASYAGLFDDEKAREQINALQDQFKEMNVRIVQIEATLQSQALLKLYAQIETLVLEQRKLQGQLEVLTNQNSLLQKRQRDFYVDLDNRLRHIEDPDAPVAKVMSDAPITAKTPLSTSNTDATSKPIGLLDSQPITNIETANSEDSDIYEIANNLFKNGDYAGAILQFKALINRNPISSLAPSAAYWIGNAHYALRDFQKAISTQIDLISAYPGSDKVPDALLNIASSQREMAKRKVAKATLEDLVARYPFSYAAEKAKQRLANY